MLSRRFLVVSCACWLTHCSVDEKGRTYRGDVSGGSESSSGGRLQQVGNTSGSSGSGGSAGGMSGAQGGSSGTPDINRSEGGEPSGESGQSNTSGGTTSDAAGVPGVGGADGWGEGGQAGSTGEPPISGLHVLQIAAGSNHTCALLSDQTVKCWGGNGSGELGDGTDVGALSPVAVSGLSDVTALAAGGSHTCALLTDRTIRCWGDNGRGQLGTGDFVTSLKPRAVVGISDATQIAAGDMHTCALRANQSVRCWGNGEVGQLGDGTSYESKPANSDSPHTPLPVDVSGLSAIIQIALGDQHSCALRRDRFVACWGNNASGELANRSAAEFSPLATTVWLDPDVTQVAAGDSYTCALLVDHTVSCWGKNDSGQVGDFLGETAPPVLVKGIAEVAQVSTGDSHACVVLTDRTVRCWGWNEWGQLGAVNYGANGAPVIVDLPGPVAQVSAGGYHSCALMSNRKEIYCWGHNQLVGDAVKDTFSPVPIGHVLE
ncbi:MAG TPA: hypothetical protein VFQ61_34120 [Polyangiaceae bacterium]|nr:hypothetical protein [Polyangiaceae bacterium]